MMDTIDPVMKEVAELQAEQKRNRDSYCEKLIALADSIIETRIRVNEMMADELMEYYGLDSSLERQEVFEMALKTYYDGGTAGLFDALVKASDWLRLEIHKVRTEAIRTPFM